MTSSCNLLAGPVAWSAQLALLLIVIAALVWKRWSETPRRSWNIWCLDVSKQAFSSGAAHICGIIIATYVEHTTSSASQCGWYFVTYTVDTTLGVLIAVTLHYGFVKLAAWVYDSISADKFEGRCSTLVLILDSLKNTGNYGNPVSYVRFSIQATEWVFSTIAARAVCGALIANTTSILKGMAIQVDSLFPGRPNLELFFVMVTCPLLMNVIQAVIQDQVLKFRSYRKKRTGDSTALLEPPSPKELSAPVLP